jgi:hypothetical protein
MSILESEKINELPDLKKEKKLSNFLRTHKLLNKVRAIPAGDLGKK